MRYCECDIYSIYRVYVHTSYWTYSQYRALDYSLHSHKVVHMSIIIAYSERGLLRSADKQVIITPYSSVPPMDIDTDVELIYIWHAREIRKGQDLRVNVCIVSRYFISLFALLTYDQFHLKALWYVCQNI